MDDVVSKLPGSDLQKHLHECVEHLLLTEQQLKEAKTVALVTLTSMFQVAGKDYAKFWCTLYEGKDYKDLAKVNWHYYNFTNFSYL